MATGLYEANVVVTGANPAPGREYIVQQGKFQEIVRDMGAGLNVYIAGGTGPSGSIPLTGQVDATFDLPLRVEFMPPGSSSVVEVSASAASVQLVASNLSRLGILLSNESSGTLYVQLSAPAATSSFSLKVSPGSFLNIPFTWGGPVSGFWKPATGSVMVTELF